MHVDPRRCCEDPRRSNKMAAKRAGEKVFDWKKWDSILPDSMRPEYLRLKGRYEARRGRMLSLPAEPPAIDWAFYKQNIAVPGMVESFQKQYEALKVPYPPDTTSAAIKERETKTESQVQQFIKEAKEKAVELKKELAVLKSQPRFEDMTIDEYLKDKPKLKKKIDDDTYNHNWYPSND